MTIGRSERGIVLHRDLDADREATSAHSSPLLGTSRHRVLPGISSTATCGDRVRTVYPPRLKLQVARLEIRIVRAATDVGRQAQRQTARHVESAAERELTGMSAFWSGAESLCSRLGEFGRTTVLMV